MPKERASSVLTGVAGEYYVAAELTRRGYIASLTMRNTRGTDIVVTNGLSGRHAAIQVKTTRKKEPSWLLSAKDETPLSDTHFYVFVNIVDEEPPVYRVVPGKTVAESLRQGFEQWVSTPGRNGHVRDRDNKVRRFNDKEGLFVDRWDLLGLDPTPDTAED
ncbi:hypothetical protein [Paraburkholderia tropica]|uniref:hypothetical protein n=1 Tax=Paraburkholderia tropica TaxID=92647 RepID=UPI0012EA8FF9|nr:hypothetical protein [Paraburkholderia tropica]